MKIIRGKNTIEDPHVPTHTITEDTMHSKERLTTSDSDYHIYRPSAVATKLYLYPLVIGQFKYEPGYYLHRNSFDGFLLMYIKKGSCTVKTEGSTFTAVQNQLVLIDCSRPHEYGNQTDHLLDIVWMHFDGILARNYYEIIINSHTNLLTIPDNYSIHQRFDRLLSLFRESAPINEAAVSKDITDILSELLNQKKEEKKALSQATHIEKALAFINEHFREQISLESIAAHCNLSPYYFTRIFTESTGYTPHQYLIATRINYAKFQLQSLDLPIKKIAFSSGFNSESSFCTTFRKWEGVTPSEYRENVGSSNLPL